MPGLIELPTEILQTIFEHVPQNSLLSLCFTNKTINNCVTSQLYHSVHILELERVRADRPGRQIETLDFIDCRESWRYDPEQSTRIYRPFIFYQTLKASPTLKSYVHRASFKWRSFSDSQIAQDVKAILRLIGRSLQMLHISFPEWDSFIPERVNLTSTETVYQGWVSPLSREDVYALFSVRTLRHISMRGAMDLNRFKTPRDDEELAKISKRAQTSNVVSLSLIDCARFGKDLMEIISWPRALKSFIWTPVLPTSGPHWVLHVDELGQMLEYQGQTLEQIVLDNLINSTFSDGAFSSLLQCFPKLKRLALSQEYMVRRLSEGAELEDTFPSLPPTLEELILRLSWRIILGARGQRQFPGLEIVSWVRAIIDSKKKLSIPLRRLVFWGRRSRLFDEQEWSEKTLRGEETFRNFDFLNQCAAVGIEFSFLVCYSVPDFQKSSCSDV